jgi:hypothetical protein
MYTGTLLLKECYVVPVSKDVIQKGAIDWDTLAEIKLKENILYSIHKETFKKINKTLDNLEMFIKNKTPECDCHKEFLAIIHSELHNLKDKILERE